MISLRSFVFKILSFINLAKFIKLNILKTKDLKEIITVNNIDSVIHLAANLVIGEGESNQKNTLKTMSKAP